MEFFLEMLLTAVVSLLFSFLVSQLVSVAMEGDRGSGGNDPTSDQGNKPVDYDFVTEELQIMDATVLESQRNFQVVDENVEKDPAHREELVVRTAEAESTAAEISGGIGVEREELMVQTTEAVSLENVVVELIMIGGQEERSESTSACVENEDVVEVRVEEGENKIECITEKESESSKEKEELSIEEDDDDWEGIEWSELEKAFAAAANYLEESKKAEEIGAESKMELYGLHKIATQGSCREAQPMAVMVAARAKWNAWQKLGNMNQEEAMEKYLALISKEIPGWMNTEH